MQKLVLKIDRVKSRYVKGKYVEDIAYQKYLQADDMDGIYRQYYELVRSERYNYRYFWKFAEEELNKEFLEWENKNETIEMYYGNSFYD